jgi:hypothetical protein
MERPLESFVTPFLTAVPSVSGAVQPLTNRGR